MILAHLPAGYVFAKLAYKRFPESDVSWKLFLAIALIGSITPDLDFIYFQIDRYRPYHHHAYWWHFPILWGGFSAMAAIWYKMAKQKWLPTLALALGLNALLHLCLDSVAGSIRWAAPFNTLPYSLTTVPRVTGSRRLDYLIHWSAWLELIPILWAWCLWRRKPVSGVENA